MKSIVLLLAFSAVASGLEWTNLYVKWNTWLLDYFRTNSFYPIPLTADDALTAAWVEVSDLNSLGLTTYCYPNDGQFCVILDGYSHVAGFQASIQSKDVDVAGEVYQTSNFKMYQNKTIFDNDYVTVTVYTVDPVILKAGGRSDWQNLTGTDGLWIEQSDGTYWEIPKNLTDLSTDWIAERCIPEMGTHYYYNMTTTTDCVNFLPIFLMYQGGVLMGGGLQAFGSCTIINRSWCETVPTLAMEYTVPTYPECLATWCSTYGVISIHFYFNANPWDYTCS